MRATELAAGGAQLPAIAVLGSGLLGSAIAHTLAAHGAVVSVYDPEGTALDRARGGLESVTARMVDLRLWNSATVAAAERITWSSDLRTVLAPAGLVIEAAPEDLQIKRRLFEDVEAMVGATTVLASNSSSLTASAIGAGLRHRDRMLNLHFFNPAQVIPLVEVCPSPSTAPSVTQDCIGLLVTLGKVPVLIRKEMPGLVANRLQAALLRESLNLVEQGVVTPAELDTIVTTSIGRRLGHAGPFRVADRGGLDVFASLSEQIFPSLDNRVDVPALLGERVADGDVGVKSGQGFYPHETDDAAREGDWLFSELARWHEGPR